MTRHLLSVLIALVIAAGGEEPPQIATVDMEVVFAKFERRTAAEAENLKKLEELSQNPRILAVRNLDAELVTLATTVRDETLSDEIREKAATSFNSQSIEYTSLVSEMDRFIKSEKQRMTVDFVQKWEELITEARAAVAQIGEEGDFDLVVEIGGKTSSMLPSILFLSSGTDITELVVARLNRPADSQ